MTRVSPGHLADYHWSSSKNILTSKLKCETGPNRLDDMVAKPGLRERKKRRTRELIAETAKRLFSERGFDAVTVAEVANAAEVSPGTVFNYFPTKEDLFYSEMQSFEEKLLEAVRNRAPGESVLKALRRVFLSGYERLANDEAAEMIAKAARIVRASPALQAREREIDARSTDVLAALLTEEAGRAANSVEAWVVANALMGIHRALIQDVHSKVLSGHSGRGLVARARSQGTRAFAVLEGGLAEYGER
jgi:AcrR family transcriptional regulator